MQDFYDVSQVGNHDIERGLLGFRVKPIRANDPDLPPNIFITQETYPAAAYMEMYWAVHTPPYNVAVWPGAIDTVPKAARTELARVWANPSNGFDFSINTRPMPYEGHLKELSEKFERAVTQSANISNALIRQWFNATLSAIKSFPETLPTKFGTLYVAPARNPLTNGWAQSYSHIDGAGQGKLTKKTYAGFAFRKSVLWPHSQSSVLIADNRDLTKWKEKGKLYNTESWRYSFAKPYPTFWQASPWAMSMINGDFDPNDPCVHLTPVIQHGQPPMRRMLLIHGHIIEEKAIEQALKEGKYNAFLEKHNLTFPEIHAA